MGLEWLYRLGRNHAACGGGISYPRPRSSCSCCTDISCRGAEAGDIHTPTQRPTHGTRSTMLNTLFERGRNVLLYGHYIPVDYFVFDQQRLVYISVPKVACTSIKSH